MSTWGHVVAVTCLALEARIALGPGVAVICNHASKLVASLEAAAKRGAAGIISFGIAGGLAPHLAAGDWVVASGVANGEDVIATDRAWAQRLLEILPGAIHANVVGANNVMASPEEKIQLHDETGAAAVDMESHIAAEVAAADGVPFAACRVIIDSAHRALPAAAVPALDSNGAVNVFAVIRSVVRKPGQLPDLARAARDAFTAERALRKGRKQLGL